MHKAFQPSFPVSTKSCYTHNICFNRILISPSTSPILPSLKTRSRHIIKNCYNQPSSVDDPFQIQVQQPTWERYKAISRSSLHELAVQFPRLLPNLEDIRLSSLVFPFKASPYVISELIDWNVPGDISSDPFYRLVFPTMDMLSEEHRQRLLDANALGDPSFIKHVVKNIRAELNPHPAGQLELNVPEETTGIQHKYDQTVLVFPSAAQTCHAYCTYCFRWAQFIGDSDYFLAQREASSLFDYLYKRKEVSDVLFTGGDPMVMKTRVFREYLEPLTDATFLPHVQNIRIGTRALSFWPQRFTSDRDSTELIELLRKVTTHGKRHVAIMAHLGHPRELSTRKFRDAVHRLQQEANVVIRSQAPLMRGINDDAELWAAKWREEVRLGIVPYYMFVARDTGAREFFDIPLAKAHKLYSEAIQNTSGLARTARGPSMSCTPGKVEVVGTQNLGGEKVFVLRFLQCRDGKWVGKPFFARFDENAVWYDELQPAEGMKLPWDSNFILSPVPAID